MIKLLKALFLIPLLLVSFSPAFADGSDFTLSFLDGFLDMLQNSVNELAFHIKYVDELYTVNQYVEQYQEYNRDYYNRDFMPERSEVDAFSEKVHKLRMVKDNCDTIDVWKLIQSNQPVDDLRKVCDFPNNFDERLAKKILSDA